ncbi:diaminopimelate epimerase [Catenulispora sp. GAS73]|uniref:diaminopimelate epimerase n=1 Tax=Catenulispora sp. GAS73 TaxID=3156269 RepID=UPI003518D495
MPTKEPNEVGREPTRSVTFAKLVAAGNDFILLDADRHTPPRELSAFAVWACRREYGIGADGVLVIRRHTPDHILLTVVNPDGSVAKMCGNGARCAAFHVLQSGASTQLTVELRGRERTHVLKARRASGDMVEVTSPQPTALEGPFSLYGFDFYRIDTGTEYAVTFVEDVNELDVTALGRAVRNHPCFAPGGTSVAFAEWQSEELKVRTYERGNEAETLSCGSAAVACAMTARHLGLTVHDPIRVHNRSDTPLAVRITGVGPGFTELVLAGPAQQVFTGNVTWPKEPGIMPTRRAC